MAARRTGSAWIHGTSPYRWAIAVSYLAGAVVGWVVLDGSGPWWLALVGVDLGAGVVAHTTTSTAQWYASRSVRAHVWFVVAHLVHLAAMSVAFGVPLAWALTTFAFLASGVVIVRSVPRSAALPVAFAVVAVGTAVHAHPLDTASLVPLLMVKVVAGFGVHARRTAS